MDMDNFSCYDKDGKIITSEEWSRRLADPKYKILCHDCKGEYFISTVWLGLNHNFDDNDAGILIFETMVFLNSFGNEVYVERYSTVKDAVEGHQRILENLEEYVNE